VLSSDAVSCEICRKEVAFAASLNKRFAPIVCRPVDVAKVPSELSRLNFISFEDAAQFESKADKLSDALSTDIEWIRKHTEFGDLARRWWEANPRPRGLLLRSPMLKEAEHWIASRPKDAPSPTDATHSFIVESRKFETLARKRRRRIAVLLCVLALALIGGGVGWWKQAWLKEQYQWRMMGPSVLTSERERVLKPKDGFAECKKGCPTMLVVPAGTFLMGTSASELERFSKQEAPGHEVRFPNEGPQQIFSGFRVARTLSP
jgi:hypothetical protein